MSTATKRPANRRPVQAPKRRSVARRWPPWAVLLLAALGLIAVLVPVALLARQGSDGDETAAPAPGLPNTPDYHSLLVAPSDAQRMLLGTHQGLYRSTDGGRTWAFADLSGQDAMNLSRPTDSTIWAAGHNMLAKSTDGGATWTDVRPDGLPGLDLHGFASDPRSAQTLYAAVAGQGLYRSSDGGGSFALVSNEVGPAVMALAVAPDGRILAGDMEHGLLMSRDGGKNWTPHLPAGVMGLAINPKQPKRVLATANGIHLSRDGGETWAEVLPIPDGAGPVAWSASDPELAYVVGFDRVLYRSTDGGRSWRPVTERG
jgi:photosystem II stability/assembly factor-like uncharacterized protein